MSAEAISKVSYGLESLNEVAYNLVVNFHAKDGSLHSRKVIQFQQQCPQQVGTVTDVITKNSLCQIFSFEKREVQEAKKVMSMVQADAPGPFVAVFDFKDPTYGYGNHSHPSILQNEDAAVNFFANPLPAGSKKSLKDIHGLFHSAHPIDFILCEGSLKTDILTKFEDKQIEFLNSKDFTEGFCICAEYFMHGFKQGQAPNDMQPLKYFKAVSKQTQTYAAQTDSKVFYPPLYKDTYGPYSDFVKSLMPIFNVVSKANLCNGIVTLSVRKK